MLKKSQITAFILMGILAFIIIGAIGYVTSSKYSKEEPVPNSMELIKRYVNDCLKETAENAVMLAGVQGGVIYFSDIIPHEETFYSFSTYWYDSGKDTSVSKDFITSEINSYIEKEMESKCINGFKEFHQVIEAGDIKADTEIKEGYVDVVIEYPVTLIENDARTMISRFNAVIPAKMGKAIDIADDIVAMEQKDPDYVPLTELGNMDMLVVPYKHNDDVMIYSIVDEDNKINGMDFKLMFANRFEGNTDENRDPKLLNAENVALAVGEQANLKFIAFDPDNDQLSFDSIGEFKIEPDGTMRITPTEKDIGEHKVTIIVDDGKGGTDYETIRILVGAA